MVGSWFLFFILLCWSILLIWVSHGQIEMPWNFVLNVFFSWLPVPFVALDHWLIARGHIKLFQTVCSLAFLWNNEGLELPSLQSCWRHLIDQFSKYNVRQLYLLTENIPWGFLVIRMTGHFTKVVLLLLFISCFILFSPGSSSYHLKYHFYRQLPNLSLNWYLIPKIHTSTAWSSNNNFL